MTKKFDTYEFLEEYQKYSCLWLKCLPEFKNRGKRDAAEKALLEVSGLQSINTLRAKIRSIRGTYNQERGKVKTHITTGSGRSDVYKPRLVWYEFADSFLKQNEASNDSESNLETAEHENVDNQFSDTPNNSIPSSSDMPSPQDDSEKPEPRTFPARKKKRVDSQKSNLGDSLDNAVQILKQVAQRSDQPSNEFTHFGLHVASQLHTLPLREALNLQSDIQALITSARIRQLSEPTPIPSRSSKNEDVQYSDQVLVQQASSSANEDVQYNDQVEIIVQETDEAGREGMPNFYTYYTNWSSEQNQHSDQVPEAKTNRSNIQNLT